MRKVIILSLVLVISANVVGETVYFLVGEINPTRNDSYVLPLTDPNDIAHARGLLEFGHNIIVANIECCSCSINRDYLSPGKPLWRWRVTEFLGFAEITAEILDGWPGFVDADCAGWITNTGGTIGFWSYTCLERTVAQSRLRRTRLVRGGRYRPGRVGRLCRSEIVCRMPV